MENKSHAMAAGLFVVVVACLLAGLALWLTRDRHQYVEFELSTKDAISGLQVQATVRYKGVSVGKVTRIGFDPQASGNVLIRIAVDAEAPISPKTTYAQLGYQGVTGIAHIQLDDSDTPQSVLTTGPSGLPRLPMRSSPLTVLADRFEGKRLNAPNDVVVHSDGSVWFSDPLFGILSNYEGFQAQPELPTHVYRLEPDSGRLDAVVSSIHNPNGLCFSPDERLLYVVDNGSTPNRILVYAVGQDGSLDDGRTFVEASTDAIPDGIRCDTDGNVWAGWGPGPALSGVMVFAPDATAIGRIALPDRCANLCFGGAKRNRLFMASSHSLYALYVETRGAA